MRTFLIIMGLAVAGCGIHNFDAKAKSPTHTTDHEADVGPFNSESNAATADSSDYRVCLAQYEGLPDRETFCREKMWAGRPAQCPTCTWGYGYGYPGSFYNPGYQPYTVPPSAYASDGSGRPIPR